MGVVKLNGQDYITNGYIVPQPVTEFNSAVRQGNATYDDRNLSSFIVFDNFRGGFGVHTADLRQQPNVYWDSEGVDPRWERQLILGPLRFDSPSIAQGAASTFHSFAEFGGILYMSVGSSVHKWDDVNDVPVSVLTTAQEVTDLVIFNRKLYVFTNGDTYHHSIDGTTWSSTTLTEAPRTGIVYDSKLVAHLQNSTKTVNKISFSLNGTSWTDLISLPAGDYKIMGWAIFPDHTGTPVIYISTNALGESNIYILDFFARTLTPLPIQFRSSDLIAHFIVPYNGSLLYNNETYITRITPSTITNIGPGGEHRETVSLVRTIMGITTSPNMVFYKVRGGEPFGNAPSVYVWDTVGHHRLFRPLDDSSTPSTRNVYYFHNGTPPKLFTLSVVQGPPAASFVSHINLPSGTENPLFSTTTYYYASSGWLITPWTDGGFADLTGAALQLDIDGDLTSTETVQVEYQINGDESTWSNLGTFNGTTKLLEFGGGAGVSFRTIRFRFTLTRNPSDSTKTPVVRAIVFRFLKFPKLRRQWNFVIDVEGTAAQHNNRDVETILSEIAAAYDSDTLVPFQYGRVNTNVKVVTFVPLELPVLNADGVDTGQRTVKEVRVQVAEVT